MEAILAGFWARSRHLHLGQITSSKCGATTCEICDAIGKNRPTFLYVAPQYMLDYARVNALQQFADGQAEKINPRPAKKAQQQRELVYNYLFLLIFLKGSPNVNDRQQATSSPIVFLPSAGLWSTPCAAGASAMSTAFEEHARQRNIAAQAAAGASVKEIMSQLTIADIISVLGLLAAALVVFWPY